MRVLRRIRRSITYLRGVSTRRPPHRVRAAAALAAAALLAVPATALGASDVLDRTLLWATVNVCDTESRDDVVGIRASMPGSGRRSERMYLRIFLQFRGDDGEWRRVASGGDSGWIELGHGRVRAREAGRDFEVTPPRSGSARFRGLVHYRWRRGDETVRRARRVTTAGHGDTVGADPAGASAATCLVR